MSRICYSAILVAITAQRECTFTVSAAKESIGATANVPDKIPIDAIAVFHHAAL